MAIGLEEALFVVLDSGGLSRCGQCSCQWFRSRGDRLRRFSQMSGVMLAAKTGLGWPLVSVIFIVVGFILAKLFMHQISLRGLKSAVF